MLDTAVSMVVDTEHGSLRTVSLDRGDIAREPFAKSFGESTAASDVGTAVKANARQLKTANGCPNGSAGVSWNDPSTRSGEVLSMAITDQVALEVKTATNTALTRNPAASIAGRVLSKSEKVVDSRGDEIPTAEIHKTVMGLPVEQKSIVVERPTETDLHPDMRIAASDNLLVSAETDDLVIQQPTEHGGKPGFVGSINVGTAESIVSSKKTTKCHDRMPGSRYPLKAVDGVQQLMALQNEPIAGMEPECTAAIPVAVAPLLDGQPSEASKNAEDHLGTEIFPIVVPRAKAATKLVPEKALSKSTDTAIATVSDVETTPSNSGSDSNKSTWLSASGEIPQRGKIQGGGATLAAITVASAAGGTVESTGGHRTAVVAVAKSPPEDESAHPLTLRTSSAEPDGFNSTPFAVVEGAHKTLTATPTALEVGIANGTHGWLKIRAETAGGGVVNATLSAASSAGQEMLHRELPSLATFLQGERVSVNSVVVHSSPVGMTRRDFTGTADGEGRGQSQQQGSQEGRGHRQGVLNPAFDIQSKPMYYSAFGRTSDQGLLTAGTDAVDGNWLSVRA